MTKFIEVAAVTATAAIVMTGCNKKHKYPDHQTCGAFKTEASCTAGNNTNHCSWFGPGKDVCHEDSKKFSKYWSDDKHCTAAGGQPEFTCSAANICASKKMNGPSFSDAQNDDNKTPLSFLRWNDQKNGPLNGWERVEGTAKGVATGSDVSGITGLVTLTITQASDMAGVTSMQPSINVDEKTFKSLNVLHKASAGKCNNGCVINGMECAEPAAICEIANAHNPANKDACSTTHCEISNAVCVPKQEYKYCVDSRGTSNKAGCPTYCKNTGSSICKLAAGEGVCEVSTAKDKKNQCSVMINGAADVDVASNYCVFESGSDNKDGVCTGNL